jgi:hypothetical protein
MRQRPERRRLGTGGNTTRSALTPHRDMRRRRSSALHVTDKGSLNKITYDYVVLFKLFPKDSHFKWTKKRGATQATPPHKRQFSLSFWVVLFSVGSD